MLYLDWIRSQRPDIELPHFRRHDADVAHRVRLPSERCDAHFPTQDIHRAVGARHDQALDGREGQPDARVYSRQAHNNRLLHPCRRAIAHEREEGLNNLKGNHLGSTEALKVLAADVDMLKGCMDGGCRDGEQGNDGLDVRLEVAAGKGVAVSGDGEAASESGGEGTQEDRDGCGLE